jgi:anti-sigma factor RsiW
VKRADDRNGDLDLMMHVDGELDSTEERALGTTLESATARAKVAAVRELGELVRGHVELSTDEAEPRLAAMWSELAKRLDNEAAPVGAAKATAGAPKAQGWWQAVGRWFERYRGHLLTGTVSAGAVAAVALLLRPTTPLPEHGDRSAATNPGTGAVPATFVSAPPEIESLDVPNGTGTVLTMEDEDGATAIVWVTPDDAEGI